MAATTIRCNDARATKLDYALQSDFEVAFASPRRPCQALAGVFPLLMSAPHHLFLRVHGPFVRCSRVVSLKPLRRPLAAVLEHHVSSDTPEPCQERMASFLVRRDPGDRPGPRFLENVFDLCPYQPSGSDGTLEWVGRPIEEDRASLCSSRFCSVLHAGNQVGVREQFSWAIHRYATGTRRGRPHGYS